MDDLKIILHGPSTLDLLLAKASKGEVPALLLKTMIDVDENRKIEKVLA